MVSKVTQHSNHRIFFETTERDRSTSTKEVTTDDRSVEPLRERMTLEGRDDARRRFTADTNAGYRAHLLNQQLEDNVMPVQIGISADNPFGYRVDETGEWVDLPGGRGSWDAEHVAWFLRDGGYESFDQATEQLGVEGMISAFDRWNYNQWNGPALHESNVAGHDVGYRVDEHGTEWVTLPEGRGEWDMEHAKLGAEALGHESVGEMFAERGVDGAIDAFNGWLYQHFNPDNNTGEKIMDRASVVADEINSTGGYRFNGVDDCYGFIKRVWNPMLAEQGLPPLPDADGPNSSAWSKIEDWSQLEPGDVLSTADGHQWGEDWHGGIYAGMIDGKHYIWDASSSTGGASLRPLPSTDFFSYFYQPTHDVL